MKYLSSTKASRKYGYSLSTLRGWAISGKIDFITNDKGHRFYAEQDLKQKLYRKRNKNKKYFNKKVIKNGKYQIN